MERHEIAIFSERVLTGATDDQHLHTLIGALRAVRVAHLDHEVRMDAFHVLDHEALRIRRSQLRTQPIQLSAYRRPRVRARLPCVTSAVRVSSLVPTDHEAPYANCA